MTYPAATYGNFIAIGKGERVTIKGKLAYQGLESFGNMLMYVIPAFVVTSLVSYSLPYVVRLDPTVTFYILLVVFFLAIYPGIKAVNYYFTQVILLLDVSKGTISELGSDTFEAALGDITEITVLEEKVSGGEQKVYRLQYSLVDGKKTSGFAFTSFNKAEELITVLKSTVEGK